MIGAVLQAAQVTVDFVRVWASESEDVGVKENMSKMRRVPTGTPAEQTAGHRLLARMLNLLPNADVLAAQCGVLGVEFQTRSHIHDCSTCSVDSGNRGHAHGMVWMVAKSPHTQEQKN